MIQSSIFPEKGVGVFNFYFVTKEALLVPVFVLDSSMSESLDPYFIEVCGVLDLSVSEIRDFRSLKEYMFLFLGSIQLFHCAQQLFKGSGFL